MGRGCHGLNRGDARGARAIRVHLTASQLEGLWRSADSAGGHRALVAGRVGLRKSFRRGDRFEIPSRIGGSPVIAMAHATLPDGHPGTVRSDAVPKKLTQPTLQRYSTKRRTGSSAPVKQGTTRLRSLFTMDLRRSVTSEAVSTGTIIVPSKHVVRRVRARKSAAGAEYPITTSSFGAP